LIHFLEQNNLVEQQQQQLLNSQLLNVQLAKNNQLQPEGWLLAEAVHKSQNTAKNTAINTQVQTTAQISTQISATISANPTQTINLLPTVATTNSSFPNGLSSKMPKIAKS